MMPHGEVSVRAPDGAIPRYVAAFSGIWVGKWKDASGRSLDHMLVVENIDRTGGSYRIVAVYSTGTEPRWGINSPRTSRQGGLIDEDGVLRLEKFDNGASVTYKLSPYAGWLSGEYRAASGHSTQGTFVRASIFVH